MCGEHIQTHKLYSILIDSIKILHCPENDLIYISVTGAAIGAHDYVKAKIALSYSTKLGVLIECIIGAFLLIFATQIAYVFTQSEGGTHITADLAHFLRVMFLFYPIAALGFFSSSFFQGAGRGMDTLIALLRTVVFTPLFAALFAFTFNMGQVGAWWGMVIGNGLGSLIMYLWAGYYLRALIRTNPLPKVTELQPETGQSSL